MSEHSDLWNYLDSVTRNPQTVTIEGGSVPPPYRLLLVHSEPMTLVLESFYQEEVQLKVLSQEASDKLVTREVFLVRKSDGKPVVVGLIRIQLEHLPGEARRRVPEADVPLGRLLQELRVQYSNRPTTFFRIVSDGVVGQALGLSNPCDLYGRRNLLLMPSGEILADVIEILAPCEPGSG